MHEKQVNLGCVVACGMWLTTFTLLVVATVGAWLDNWEVATLGIGFGLAFSAAAATVTIRQFFVRQNQLLRDAFELGRESRDSAGVRRISG